ncbi:DUF1924 domain-containing protein [Methyloterricola oryzae]|uniref:DUF1924 domain-containing protein n=1 Tax=Methyloterricola oryzae TaxID=1495050 RepID=UPI00069AFD78|nr:DUF1924 domain-containing protein [Methyloterricola oryzae]
MRKRFIRPLLAASLLGVNAAGLAMQPTDFLEEFRQQAAADNAAFAGFDAARGEQFFKSKHGDWSCASCHTDDPRTEGKHAVTEKRIKPLVPAANPERFTDSRKVAKWFKRNCKDVLDRECRAQEKGDVLTYLIQLTK